EIEALGAVEAGGGEEVLTDGALITHRGKLAGKVEHPRVHIGREVTRSLRNGVGEGEVMTDLRGGEGDLVQPPNQGPSDGARELEILMARFQRRGGVEEPCEELGKRLAVTVAAYVLEQRPNLRGLRGRLDRKMRRIGVAKAS